MNKAPINCMVVWGDKGAGKTMFGLTSPYKPILHLDTEYSARTYYQRRKPLGLDFEWRDCSRYMDDGGLKETLASVKPGQWGTIIIDTGGQWGSWVAREFQARNRARMSKQSSLVWSEINDFLKSETIRLMGSCEVLILTAHARNAYDFKRKEERIKPVLLEVAELSLHLVRNPNEQLPIALVEGKNRLGGVLPPRVVPGTWGKILEYIANPADWDNLKPEELAPELVYPTFDTEDDE